MRVFQRSDTFQKQFNLPDLSHKSESPALSERPSLEVSQLRAEPTRPRSKKRRLLSRTLWWASLLVVSALPVYAVFATDLPAAWSSIDDAIKETLEFPKTHKIRLPSPLNEEDADAPEDAFENTNADLVRWHRDMSRLHKQIAESTPIGSVQDSTLEFVFTSNSKSPAREWRAAAVSMYFVMAASLYFVDSIHIALILLQFNVLEFSLAIKIKRLDDALERTLEQLSGRHMDLAMMPLQKSSAAIGRQLICLQKMEIFYNTWNQVNLGQNIRIPFRKDFVNLNLSLVFSIVAAVFLRSLEVLLLAIWPSLPRFNLSTRLYTWVRRGISGTWMQQATKADGQTQSMPAHEPSIASSRMLVPETVFRLSTESEGQDLRAGSSPSDREADS